MCREIVAKIITSDVSQNEDKEMKECRDKGNGPLQAMSDFCPSLSKQGNAVNRSCGEIAAKIITSEISQN